MHCAVLSTTPFVRAVRVCLIVLTLCACEGQLTRSHVVERNGLVFEIGATEPFTGIVVGTDRKGYRGAVRHFKKHYTNGALNGKSEYWYANDQLEGIEHYKDGRIHGVVSRYYNNGQIRSRVHYVHGLRGGSNGEMFWDKNGKLLKG